MNTTQNQSFCKSVKLWTNPQKLNYLQLFILFFTFLILLLSIWTTRRWFLYDLANWHNSEKKTNLSYLSMSLVFSYILKIQPKSFCVATRVKNKTTLNFNWKLYNSWLNVFFIFKHLKLNTPISWALLEIRPTTTYYCSTRFETFELSK